jgi:hypothetical protein
MAFLCNIMGIQNELKQGSKSSIFSRKILSWRESNRELQGYMVLNLKP